MPLPGSILELPIGFIYDPSIVTCVRMRISLALRVISVFVLEPCKLITSESGWVTDGLLD